MKSERRAPEESSAPETAPPAARLFPRRTPPANDAAAPGRRARWPARLTWAAIAAAVLLVAGASHLLDEPLRRTLERRINQKLTGYSVRLGHAHVNVFRLALELRAGVIRQNANPEPPVAEMPVLRASVEWKELLSLHLVADAVFDRPRLHVDLAQFRSDARDAVPLRQRGWQQALESIFPLKFNRIAVVEGSLAYIDTDPGKPLLVERWNLTAENVRNIHSRDRVYPSSLHSEGLIFGQGRASVDGHADFLAEPFPAVHVLYALERVPLDRLRPIIERANLVLRGGSLSSAGRVEYGPRFKDVRADTVTIEGLRGDYLHTPATAAAEKRRAREAVEATEEAATPMRIERLRLAGAELGLEDRTRTPHYRVFLDRVELEATHLAVGPVPPATTRAELRGRFMGTGRAHATAEMRGSGDFAVAAALEEGSLPKLNDVLRAYGKFDVSSGSFSVFTELAVKNGRVDGYVKPLFTGVNVYDPRQDARKPALRKLYEHLVDAAARLLRNRKSADVATQFDISGPLEDPNASTWQTLVNLLSNAFVKAILPGFDREVERLRRGGEPSPRRERARSEPAGGRGNDGRPRRVH